jgi:membrane protease YdiL (CAAX protease family)
MSILDRIFAIGELSRKKFFKYYYPNLSYSTWPNIFRYPLNTLFTAGVFFVGMWGADFAHQMITVASIDYLNSDFWSVILKDLSYFIFLFLSLIIMGGNAKLIDIAKGPMNFVLGFGLGLFLLIIPQLISWIDHFPEFDWQVEGGIQTISFMFLFVVGSAFFEEAIYRLGIDAFLGIIFGKYIGSFFQIILFVLAHNQRDPISIAIIAITGVILTLIRRSRFGIFCSVGVHAAINFAMLLFYGAFMIPGAKLIPRYISPTGILNVQIHPVYEFVASSIVSIVIAMWLWKSNINHDERNTSRSDRPPTGNAIG